MNSRTKKQRLWSQQRYRHQDTKRKGKVHRLDQWYPTIEGLHARKAEDPEGHLAALQLLTKYDVDQILIFL